MSQDAGWDPPHAQPPDAQPPHTQPQLSRWVHDASLGQGALDDSLVNLFDDLAAQADVAMGQEMLLEVAEQARAEYATVTLVSRLMAAVDSTITMRLAGAGAVTGRLARCTSTWGVLDAGAREWVVAFAHLYAVEGVSARSVPESAWPIQAKVGLGSALRRLADAGRPAQLHLVDGSRLDVRWGRIGRDFVEVTVGERRQLQLVAHTAIAAVAT